MFYATALKPGTRINDSHLLSSNMHFGQKCFHSSDGSVFFMKAKFVAFVQMSDGIRIEKESRADELRSKVRFTSLQTPILSLLTVLTMCSAFEIRAEKLG